MKLFRFKSERKVVFVIGADKHGLFVSDAVFVSNAKTQDEVFAETADKLLTAGYVKEEFLAHVKEREANYPTGIDVSPISDKLPNVAIPHTEGEFVNERIIVPVKLTNPIEFHNMISPADVLEVKFLFMILNNDPEGQANILAQIMDFLGKIPVDDLNNLFNMSDATEIYNFLDKNFKQA